MVFSQSYVGMFYKNFLPELISSKVSDLKTEPSKKYYSDGSYNITLIYENFVSVYTFTNRDLCVLISQFMPSEDKNIRKNVYKSLSEQFDNSFIKKKNYWVEKKTNGFFIKHTIERDKEIGYLKGVYVVSELQD